MITTSRFRHSPRGQIMLMAAAFTPVLIALTGLAIDVSHFYHIKRRMVLAADSAAMGGAHELYRRNGLGLITVAARGDAATNGFDFQKPAITVDVYNPPISGPRTGDNNFVEVVIKQDLPTYFLRMVNRNMATIRARAVAGTVAYVDFCVLALHPSARGALDVAGAATLNASCGIMVNSIDDEAIRTAGGGCIYATGVAVTGGWIANGTQNCIYPTPETDVLPALDPLAYFEALYKPNPASYPLQGTNTRFTSAETATLQPGVYRNGLHINGANITFAPGLYIIDGGDLDVSGNAIISGNGVTFYLTNSSGNPGGWGLVNIAGTVTANLVAPDSGIYEGLLFWMDANAPLRTPGNLIAGNAASVFLGALYFPSTHLKYEGTSVNTDWMMMVANLITVAGNPVVESNYDATTVVPPSRKVTLVE